MKLPFKVRENLLCKSNLNAPVSQLTFIANLYLAIFKVFGLLPETEVF